MQVAVTNEGSQSYASTVYSRQPLNAAVIVVDGYGVKISVSRGHLVIEDGVGRSRRTRRVPRVPREVARLVILSQDGFITLDAVQWCAAQSIGIHQYDRDGSCLVTSPGHATDAHLIRVQALADFRGPHARTGLRVVNRFMAAKLEAQAGVIRDLFKDDKPATVIERHASAIEDSEEHNIT